MIRIVVDKPSRGVTEPLDVPFFLSVEEWVARTFPPAEYFLTWRVAPSVIFGRNQDPHAEVNLGYCREHGIGVYRRRSGGGCVYADLDNLMVSYISPATDVTTTFAGYTGRIAAMLRSLGLDAEATGRNDVTVGGKKISGNAFYRIPGRSIVHGTLLCATDMANMLNAITPSRSKLESRMVQSVESRITTLDKVLPGFGIERLEELVCETLGTDEYHLTAADLDGIETIAATYRTDEWIMGRRGRSCTHARERRCARIPGVGEIDLLLELEGGRIADVGIAGDFFPIGDAEDELRRILRGCPADASGVEKALTGVDMGAVIAGMDNRTFISFLLEKNTGKQTI